MPANRGLRSDDCDGIHDAWVEAIEPDERQAIGIGRPQAPRRAPAQNVQLMAEQKILSFEPASGLLERRQPMQQQFDHPHHAVGMMPRPGKSQVNSRRMKFSVATIP
jgi:hypothetical protein